jgi:hypothetical protein
MEYAKLCNEYAIAQRRYSAVSAMPGGWQLKPRAWTVFRGV